jgi:hypothetical protein
VLSRAGHHVQPDGWALAPGESRNLLIHVIVHVSNSGIRAGSWVIEYGKHYKRSDEVFLQFLTVLSRIVY